MYDMQDNCNTKLHHASRYKAKTGVPTDDFYTNEASKDRWNQFEHVNNDLSVKVFWQIHFLT